jgi:glycosyltransferase involved in cell wall biosynthesis
MAPAARVGILLVPDFTPHRPLGGAEAIADCLARRLSEHCEVVVFHGHPPDEPASPEPRRHGPTLEAVAAFPRTGPVCYGGTLGLALAPAVARRLADCHVLLSFERVLAGSPAPVNYAVLGGICYPHCVEVVRSGLWDRLIVPSRFIQEAAIRHGADSGRVAVVPKGVDVRRFSPRPVEGAHTDCLVALVPSRPDWGKGLERALALARLRSRHLRPVAVHCFRQRSFSASPGFYDELCSRAEGVELVLRDWVDRREMAQVYRSADLTLCLGDLPEGFGLTAVESVACGTPVLARPVGFLRDVLPQQHGLFFDEGEQVTAGLADGLDEMARAGREDCRARGHPYVAAHYSEGSMVSAYRALIARAVGGRVGHA